MHFIPDSPVIYAGVKISRKARKHSRNKSVEVFNPEFKKAVSDFLMRKLQEKAGK